MFSAPPSSEGTFTQQMFGVAESHTSPPRRIHILVVRGPPPPNVAPPLAQNPTPAEEGQISLKTERGDGAEMVFRIKYTTTLGKLMHAYCEKMGLDDEQVRFSYNDVVLEASLTPADLGMTENDTIKVITFERKQETEEQCEAEEEEVEEEEADDEWSEESAEDSYPPGMQILLGKTGDDDNAHWWMPNGPLNLGEETLTQAAARVVLSPLLHDGNDLKLEGPTCELRVIGYINQKQQKCDSSSSPPQSTVSIVVSIDVTDEQAAALTTTADAVRSDSFWVEPEVLLQHGTPMGHRFKSGLSFWEKADEQWRQKNLLTEKGIEGVYWREEKEGETPPLHPLLVSSVEALIAQEAWAVLQESVVAATTEQRVFVEEERGKQLDDVPHSVKTQVMSQLFKVITTSGNEHTQKTKSYSRRKRDRDLLGATAVHITDRQLRDPLTVALGFMPNPGPFRQSCRAMVGLFDHAVFLEAELPNPFLTIYHKDRDGGGKCSALPKDALGRYAPIQFCKLPRDPSESESSCHPVVLLNLVKLSSFMITKGTLNLGEPPLGIINGLEIAHLPMLTCITQTMPVRSWAFNSSPVCAVSCAVLYDLPNLEEIGDHFLEGANLRGSFTLENLPRLTKIGSDFLGSNRDLQEITLRNLPELTSIGTNCLDGCGHPLDEEKHPPTIVAMHNLPKLQSIGPKVLCKPTEYGPRLGAKLSFKEIPSLTEIGESFFTKVRGPIEYTVTEDCSDALKEKLEEAAKVPVKKKKAKKDPDPYGYY